MAIQIELSPEVEARLAAEAEQQGPASPAKPRATPEEFAAFLLAFAFDAPEVPHLRDSTFSREMIYGSHP
jgi:hypothetical protein